MKRYITHPLLFAFVLAGIVKFLGFDLDNWMVYSTVIVTALIYSIFWEKKIFIPSIKQKINTEE